MSNTMDNNESAVGVLDRVVVQPPRMWNVVLFNDDTTSMEFVILILMQVFHKSLDDATDIMMNIHENGRGVAGTYSHEIASTKKDETIAVARSNGFPLQVEIEPTE